MISEPKLIFKVIVGIISPCVNRYVSPSKYNKAYQFKLDRGPFFEWNMYMPYELWDVITFQNVPLLFPHNEAMAIDGIL